MLTKIKYNRTIDLRFIVPETKIKRHTNSKGREGHETLIYF